MNIKKETLAIARNLMQKDPSLTNWIISKFPELKESEDERIRKELLNYLYDVHDDDEERARWISYLEKQGKYKQVEVRPFNTVFSQEQIDEIDKRIEKEIKLYNAKLMDAQMRAKDFQMTD